MKPDAWMPLYIADYLRDTMFLTTEQHGAYLLLLMACWTQGGRLSAAPEHLAAAAKLTPEAWAKHAPMLLPFFTKRGTMLIHKRVLDEFEKAQRMVEVKRQNGLKGGRPRKLIESSEEPIAFPLEKANGKLNETPAQVARPSPFTKEEERPIQGGGIPLSTRRQSTRGKPVG